MPLTRSLLTLVFAALAVSAGAAPVSITPASLTYLQNFDGFGTATVPWADDTTVPGWYVQINNGGTPAGSFQPADGTVVLSGLLNLGTTGSSDRALGSKATGTGNQANIACAVSFRNDCPLPVQLTQLRYAAELWRTNSGTGTPIVPINEEYTLYYRVSAAPVTNILSGATSPNASPGTGFTALGTAANWISPVNSPPATALDGNDEDNRTVVTVSPASSVVLLPGQYLMLKWTDANEAGTDGFQGLDDVSVQFTQLDGVLTPSVTDPVRDSSGTPADPSDDLFGFTVSVAASGPGPGPGWTTADVVAPNTASAAYGVPVTWSGFPVAGAKAATFTDANNPFYAVSISVPAPKLIGLNSTTPGGIVHTGLDSEVPWVIDEAQRSLTLTNDGVEPTPAVTSARVNLSTVSGVVRFSARLTARDTSSGFESDDTFVARLFLHDGVTETAVNLTTPFDTDGSGFMNGSEIAPAGGTPAAPTVREFALTHLIPDSIQSARLVISGSNNSTNETLIVDTVLFSLAPADLLATPGPVVMDNQDTDAAADDRFSASVIITSGNNAPSTGWTSNSSPATGSYADPQPVLFGPFALSNGPQSITLVDGIDPGISDTFTLTPLVPSVSITAPANVVRHENGPGIADDTVTFDVTITGANGGPRWHATGAATGFGPFGAATITIPATGPSPASITIADVSYPAAAQTLDIAIPRRYAIGWYYDGTGLTDVNSDLASNPAAEWVNDPVLHTLDMTTGGTSDKVVVSDVLDLTNTGPLWFSAVLRARDTSVASNFETADRFKAELILDGGTPSEQIVNLISSWDTGDGSGGGSNGPPNGWLNGYSGTDLADYNANRSRDELNRTGLDGTQMIDHHFLLAYTIPSGTNTARLRIAGAGISGTEFFTVSRVLFSSVPPSQDSDADGIPDLSELTDGTDPNDPSSLFTITGITTGPGGGQMASFPTVPNRLYRGYLSTDLLTWTRDDATPAVPGDGSPKSWSLPVLAAPDSRHYLKILTGFTPADFPLTLP